MSGLMFFICIVEVLMCLIFEKGEPPPWCNHICRLDRLHVQSVLGSLCLQVDPEVLVARECLVVPEVKAHSEKGIQALDLEAPFRHAHPLPLGVDTLCIQNMVRG